MQRSYLPVASICWRVYLVPSTTHPMVCVFWRALRSQVWHMTTPASELALLSDSCTLSKLWLESVSTLTIATILHITSSCSCN